MTLGWSDVRFLTNALEKAISEGGDLGENPIFYFLKPKLGISKILQVLLHI